MEVADQIVVMNDGRIEQIGAPRELYESPANEFVMGFVGPVNRLGERARAPARPRAPARARRRRASRRMVERIVHLGFEVRVELAAGRRAAALRAQLTRDEAEQLELERGPDRVGAPAARAGLRRRGRCRGRRARGGPRRARVVRRSAGPVAREAGVTALPGTPRSASSTRSATPSQVMPPVAAWAAAPAVCATAGSGRPASPRPGPRGRRAGRAGRRRRARAPRRRPSCRSKGSRRPRPQRRRSRRPRSATAARSRSPRRTGRRAGPGRRRPPAAASRA